MGGYGDLNFTSLKDMPEEETDNQLSSDSEVDEDEQNHTQPLVSFTEEDSELSWSSEEERVEQKRQNWTENLA